MRCVFVDPNKQNRADNPFFLSAKSKSNKLLLQYSSAMISILAQERLLGAALGAAFAGFIVYEQRKRIYQSISPEHPQSQLREPIFGKQFRSEFELSWNKAVDQTFGPLVASLNSRRH